MLSRFSPSKLFVKNEKYSTKHIDEIVSEVKKLGKTGNSNNVNTEDLLPSIIKILSIMKKYSNVIQIQRVCCHALSNLAMQVVVARWIMEKGGFKLIQKALIKFENDHKLCWLGSSAIWNLARPPANRQLIGKTGVQLMLKILKIHKNKEKVTNTTIGALSNLSLCDELKDIIAINKNIDIILDVLNEYCDKNIQSVLTSGAGLLANLAVSDAHANTLVNRNALPILLKVLSWNNGILKSDNIPADQQQQMETLFRNTCAALNNMVTGDEFIDSFLVSKGVETIYSFLNNNNSDLYNGLLENCLVHMECDISKPTTSIHLCSLHNKLDILKKLILNNNNSIDLEIKDDKNMTCLDYAISMNHLDIIQFLTKLGCDSSKIKLNNDNERDSAIMEAINKGNIILKTIKKENRNAVDDSLKHALPKDICYHIAEFHGVIDMLQANNEF